MHAFLNDNRFYFSILFTALVMYLGLAVGSALTKRPEVDEGAFANPAVNLIMRGSMGTTVMEQSGSALKNIHLYTYWTPPLHLLTQAGWYKIFGFSLFSMRALSIWWGLVALGSWFVLMTTLSGDWKLGLLSLALLSVDYTFIVAASMGRMDMMSAALGFAALAAYLGLRERNLSWAVLTSQCFVVASGLSHPNGILPFAGVLFLVFYYDRRRVNWWHLLIGLLPYFIGGVVWGLYIFKDLSSFVAQWKVNATMGGRLSGFTAPWLGIAREFTERYPGAFGLGEHSAGHSGPIYLKMLILIPYGFGVIGAFLTRRIREHKGYRALLILTVTCFLMLSLLDGQKQSNYLIHVFPFYVALFAIWIQYWWTRGLLLRSVIALGLVALLSLELGGSLYRMKQNTYGNLYVPTIEFLKRNSDQTEVIMGSSALGFGLKFPDNLVDDALFGYASGRRPDFIVFDAERNKPLRLTETEKPDFFLYFNRLLSEEYRTVYENSGFTVYARR